MSAALRPVLEISPMPELRAIVRARFEQYRDLALEERMQPRPCWDEVMKAEAAANALRAVLLDISMLEGRQ